MKTVQEAIANTDRQLLIDNYLLKYPLEIEDQDPTKTVSDVQEEARQQLSDYLDHLTSLTPSKNIGELVFYVYHRYVDGVPEPSYDLTSLDDLQGRGGEAETFSCVYTDQADLMGFYIADNELTKHYLTELLVEIMYDAAFFGFHQELLEDDETGSSDDQDGPDLQPIKKQHNLREMPKTDEFTPQEKQLIKQIHDLEAKLENNSRHNAIAEILRETK